MAADSFLGEMMPFTGNFAVRNFAECIGQTISISQNTALYSLTSTFYGGDGRSNFALPDLRGRTPVSYGQSPGQSNYTIGQKTGSESITLTTEHLPAHSHSATATVEIDHSVTPTLQVASNTANTRVPNVGSFIGSPQGQDSFFLPNGFESAQLTDIQGPEIEVTAKQTSATVTVDDAGAGQPLSLLSPLTVVNWQTCIQGLYPSRA